MKSWHIGYLMILIPVLLLLCGIFIGMAVQMGGHWGGVIAVAVILWSAVAVWLIGLDE